MENVITVTNADDLFATKTHDVVAKAANDEAKRMASQRRMVEILAGIHQTRERLYQARWNQTVVYAEKKRNVLTLCRDVLRLEEDLARCRREGLKEFEESLVLDGLSLGHFLTSPQTKQVELESQTLLEDMERTAHARQIMEETELEQIKLIRVMSADQTKDKTKGEKFKMLYGQYGEWKDQKDLDNKLSPNVMKKVTSTPGPDAEVTRLRGQIHALQNKSNVTEADKLRLVELQAKLKAAQYRQ